MGSEGISSVPAFSGAGGSTAGLAAPAPSRAAGWGTPWRPLPTSPSYARVSPPTPPAVLGLRANFHPRPSARRAPRRLEMKFVVHVRKINGMKKTQISTLLRRRILLRRDAPQAAPAAHTPFFPTFSPRSQPVPIGSVRANPYGTARPGGQTGNGGDLRGEGGSRTPPELHNRSPAGAERTHGHYLRDPAPFRRDPRAPPAAPNLSPSPSNILGFSPTPPPRSKCPFLQSFLEIAPCLHCHEFPQAAWREQKAAREGSSCEQGENGEGGRGSEKKKKP